MGIRQDVKEDWEWADTFVGEVRKILEAHAGHFISVEESSAQQDLKQATDMVIKVDTGTVAVRVRRDGYYESFGDVTIRSYRSSGAKTELQKLREGWGDWYLYIWTRYNEIQNWILLNINEMRKCGILDREHKEIPNAGGRTRFIALTRVEVSCCTTATSPDIARKIPFRSRAFKKIYDLKLRVARGELKPIDASEVRKGDWYASSVFPDQGNLINARSDNDLVEVAPNDWVYIHVKRNKVIPYFYRGTPG